MKPTQIPSTRSGCSVPNRSFKLGRPSTRSTEEDLTRFAKRAGHEMVAVEDEGDHKRFLIRRGA
jgi:hypothetical protein